MKLVKVKTLLFSALLFLSAPLFAEPVNFTLKAETKELNRPFWVALDLDIEKGWHAYWKNPGEAGMAPQIEWTLPDGYAVETVEWPYPSLFANAFVYEGHTVLLAKIIPSKATGEIKVNLRWVVCNDETCLPGSSEATLTLPTEEMSAYFQSAWEKIPKKAALISTKRDKLTVESIVKVPALAEPLHFFSENQGVEVVAIAHPEEPNSVILTYKAEDPALKGVLVTGDHALEIALNDEAPTPEPKGDESFALALLFAFIGGTILNLMPCVLPVVSLKVLSFVNLAKECPWTRVKHGLFFTLGVLVSFWVLAGLMLLLQAWGRSVGWGFQLQEPLFVAVLAAIMLIFALSLFGVFEMGALFASWAGQKEATQKESSLAAFFSGVLATAVATPCTGPFLGSAIGYAFTLPPGLALTIFTFLALGMALPYLLLTSFPPLLRFVPKPGVWMETFKQAMGFLMLLATLWLTWVFAGETKEPATILLLASFFALSLACWVIGKWGTPVSTPRSRLVSYAVALLLLGATYKTLTLASSLAASLDETVAIADWEPFSASRVEELRAQGIPVFIDFTAKWCLICQANHMTLSTAEIEAKMKEKKVVKMKADWTKNDPAITAELKKWGRSGVPLYLLYGADEPQILPQVLTPDSVITSLNEIADAD